MIALNVWGRGMVRMLCALIGLGVGYVGGGRLRPAPGHPVGRRHDCAVDRPADASIISRGLSTATLALPFAIAAIAVAMKAVGTMTMCQRMNDADWVRVDMRSARRGVLADGAATMVAGAMGTVGTATSPLLRSGVASATGVGSRSVAHAAGFILLLLGLTPKLAALLAIMPRAVMVAALLFAVAFIIINGLQVMTSRLLDARRTLVIGLSIVAGRRGRSVSPACGVRADSRSAPLVGSSLAFST